jgi:hypothetical protein
MSLDRLVLADPVPTTPELDDPELFARIVSLPQERRRRPRKRIAAAVVLAAAALLTSSAVAVDHWLTGAVKPDVTLAEYRDAQSVLPLPPGATWPVLHVDPNSMTTKGGGGGYAVLIAMTRWECYWAGAIRDGGRGAQLRAKRVLHDLLAKHVVVAPDGAPEDWAPASPPAYPYAVFADDGGYGFKQRIYAQAAAGDAAGVAQSCRANG